MSKRNRALVVLDKQIEEARKQLHDAEQMLRIAEERLDSRIEMRRQIAAAYERKGPSKVEARKAKAKAIVDAIAREPGRAQEIAREAMAS